MISWYSFGISIFSRSSSPNPFSLRLQKNKHNPYGFTSKKYVFSHSFQILFESLFSFEKFGIVYFVSTTFSSEVRSFKGQLQAQYCLVLRNYGMLFPADYSCKAKK